MFRLVSSNFPEKIELALDVMHRIKGFQEKQHLHLIWLSRLQIMIHIPIG